MKLNPATEHHFLSSLIPSIPREYSPQFLGYMAVGLGLGVIAAACKRHPRSEFEFDDYES